MCSRSHPTIGSRAEARRTETNKSNSTFRAAIPSCTTPITSSAPSASPMPRIVQVVTSERIWLDRGAGVSGVSTALGWRRGRIRAAAAIATAAVAVAAAALIATAGAPVLLVLLLVLLLGWRLRALAGSVQGATPRAFLPEVRRGGVVPARDAHPAARPAQPVLDVALP